MAKIKIELEFPIKSSRRVLFNRLSTPSGLSEWFADDVFVNKNEYTFIWEGSEQKATLEGKKDMSFVRFKWIDDEDEESFFEFKLNANELTGGLALIITDFAEEDEEEEITDLWGSQVGELKHLLGI